MAETPSKPGFKTTEFWVFVLTTVAMTVLAALGKVDPDIATGVIGVGGAGYTGSRTIVKRK